MNGLATCEVKITKCVNKPQDESGSRYPLSKDYNIIVNQILAQICSMDMINILHLSCGKFEKLVGELSRY